MVNTYKPDNYWIIALTNVVSKMHVGDQPSRLDDKRL